MAIILKNSFSRVNNSWLKSLPKTVTSVEFLGMKKWVRFVRMAFPWVCFYFLRVQSPLRWKMDKAQQLSWGFLPSHQNSRKLSRKWVYLTWTYILAFFFFETYIFSWCYLKKKKKITCQDYIWDDCALCGFASSKSCPRTVLVWSL